MFLVFYSFIETAPKPGDEDEEYVFDVVSDDIVGVWILNLFKNGILITSILSGLDHSYTLEMCQHYTENWEKDV